MPKGNKVIVLGRANYFECKTCGYETASKTGFRLHRKIIHGKDVNPKSFDTDTATFECKTCREEFDNKFQLLTHARHTGHR